MQSPTSGIAILGEGSKPDVSKTVLITGIGGDVSQCVAAILQSARPDLKLVGVDMHGRHGGRLFVHKYEEISSAKEATYADELFSVIEKYEVDIVIPMSESELDVLFPDLYKELGAIWITPGEYVIDVGLDKFSTAMSLEKLGLLAPWTVLSEESMPLDYPCIFKSRRGSGSRNVFKIEAPTDASALSDRFPGGIFQELLLPDCQEVTCAVYRSQDGRVGTLQMLRRLAGGVTGWVKTINEESISEVCLRLAEGLELRGSMNVQLRLTQRGAQVFEINPRFSSTALMRHLLGFRDVVWAIEEASGVKMKLPVIPEGQIVVRTHGAQVISADRKESDC